LSFVDVICVGYAFVHGRPSAIKRQFDALLRTTSRHPFALPKNFKRGTVYKYMTTVFHFSALRIATLFFAQCFVLSSVRQSRSDIVSKRLDA